MCKWIYRPGTNGSHFAMAKCDRGFKYLSRIIGSPQVRGCADFYNGKICPACGQVIEMDYTLMNDFDEV